MAKKVADELEDYFVKNYKEYIGNTDGGAWSSDEEDGVPDVVDEEADRQRKDQRRRHWLYKDLVWYPCRRLSRAMRIAIHTISSYCSACNNDARTRGGSFGRFSTGTSGGKTFVGCLLIMLLMALRSLGGTSCLRRLAK